MNRKFLGILIALSLVAALVSTAWASTTDLIGLQSGNPALLGKKVDKEKLKEYHDRSTGLFDIEGVIFSDADEDIDRLVVGVQNKKLAKQVEKKLKELDIPVDAVDIVETQSIVPVQTLRVRVRPLQGGLQIAFSSWLCTLGFNATRSGVEGFVVNSHCTNKQGTVDGTQHYQPTVASTNLIGKEIADPSFFNGGICPKRYKCRYSDSAFSQRANEVTADLGFIERTDTVNLGSLTIAGSFRVVGEASALTGDTVNKVGRTTGWTQGRVTRTGVHTGVSGSRILLLYQDWVAAGVGGGDSGSPVFRITDSPQANDVVLYGILWGGSLDGKTFVYSPIANVQRTGELGTLTNCASGFSC